MGIKEGVRVGVRVRERGERAALERNTKLRDERVKGEMAGRGEDGWKRERGGGWEAGG